MCALMAKVVGFTAPTLDRLDERRNLEGLSQISLHRASGNRVPLSALEANFHNSLHTPPHSLHGTRVY